MCNIYYLSKQFYIGNVYDSKKFLSTIFWKVSQSKTNPSIELNVNKLDEINHVLTAMNKKI